jgi:hypothetical protein
MPLARKSPLLSGSPVASIGQSGAVLMKMNAATEEKQKATYARADASRNALQLRWRGSTSATAQAQPGADFGRQTRPEAVERGIDANDPEHALTEHAAIDEVENLASLTVSAC